jgi:hypothetical protein
MADIRLLERTLRDNVAWNKVRINFLARFIVALIEVRTVNLSEIATVFMGRAKRESHYKRVQRFLRFFEMPYAQVARFVVRLLGVPAPWVITLDRTDWYLGETPLNVMVIGIAYRGVAFPVLWTILEKKGCSDTEERSIWSESSGASLVIERLLIFVQTESLSGQAGSLGCARWRWTSASGCVRTRKSKTGADSWLTSIVCFARNASDSLWCLKERERSGGCLCLSVGCASLRANTSSWSRHALQRRRLRTTPAAGRSKLSSRA